MGSLLDRFVTDDGQILLLGCDHDNVTFLHYVEHIVDIPDKRVARLKYRSTTTAYACGERWRNSTRQRLERTRIGPAVSSRVLWTRTSRRPEIQAAWLAMPGPTFSVLVAWGTSIPCDAGRRC